MCYLCHPEFKNQSKFLTQVRVELSTIPLSDFMAGDLPLLHIIFVDNRDFAHRVPEIKALVHRVRQYEPL